MALSALSIALCVKLLYFTAEGIAPPYNAVDWLVIGVRFMGYYILIISEFRVFREFRVISFTITLNSLNSLNFLLSILAANIQHLNALVKCFNYFFYVIARRALLDVAISGFVGSGGFHSKSQSHKITKSHNNRGWG